MKKSFIISSLTALAAFCLCVTAQAQGPVVVSDKDDYSPGETALFQAAGFQPNELLDFSVAVSDDNGLWIPDIAWADVSADGSGNAEVDYVVPDTWANKSLQLTVMGLTSGLMATTTFTDAPVHNVNFSTTGLPNGVSISISGVKTPPGTTTPHPFGPDMFTTPGSFASEGTAPDTVLQFGGFLPTVPGTGEHWTLTSFSLIPGSAPGSLLGGDLGTGGGAYETGGANTGQFGTPTTIVANYTHHIDVTNHAPGITCLGNNADLGSAVGCLGTGNSFSHDFPVTYTQSGTNPVTVTANFTLADNTTVIHVPVATVTDADAGDTIAVALTPTTQTLTINGPGSGSTPFSVHIDAVDNHNAPAVPHDCGGTASATIGYAFNGVFSPLSNTATTKVKQGATVPVKFQLADCSGTLITDMNMPGDGSAPLVDVDFVSGAVPAGDPTVTDAGNSNGDTDFARWDPTGMQWIFNLKTNSTYGVGDTYKIQVFPNDGSEHHANISIK
jgi:hypothetical protein